MAKWLIAYWRAGNVDVYTMEDRRVRRIYEGSLEALERSKGWLTRRILVVGRESFIRIRKQYPPANLDKLKRAVEMEASELFPLNKPVVHCRIFETYSTHVLLDVWAWEQEPFDRLRMFFPFSHVIPEDLALLFLPPMIHIYNFGDTVHVLACGDDKFYDSASFAGANFSAADMERFFSGLDEYASVIREIRIYGNFSPDMPGPFPAKLTRLPEITYPPCLGFMEDRRIDLKPFFFHGDSFFALNQTVILRFSIYALAAYGFFLFLTMSHYENALKEMKLQNLSIDQKIALVETGGAKGLEDMDALKELQDKIKDYISPLRILDILSVDLPEESNVKSLSMNEGVIDVSLQAHDPLYVINRLSGSERIRKATLKSSPVRDSLTGNYTFNLLLEIK